MTGFAGPLSRAVAINRTLTRGEERLPGDSRGVIDPSLFGAGIAALRSSLLQQGSVGSSQPLIHLVQLALALHLYAQMIETRLSASRGDREIHARVFEHPLGIVRLGDGGLSRE